MKTLKMGSKSMHQIRSSSKKLSTPCARLTLMKIHTSRANYIFVAVYIADTLSFTNVICIFQILWTYQTGSLLLKHKISFPTSRFLCQSLLQSKTINIQWRQVMPDHNPTQVHLPISIRLLAVLCM